MRGVLFYLQSSEHEVLLQPKHIFPNTYQGIRSIRSPAKVGLVVTDLITSPVVSWRGWETPPPQHNGSTVILCMTSSGGQQGGSLGHLTYSSVSIRKNVFWLKQNFICSNRILTFGIRSRFKLRRDGDQCGLPKSMSFSSHGGCGW